MSKKQSFLKALSEGPKFDPNKPFSAPGFIQQRQQQEMERAVSDTQWLRERGIRPGGPGEWRPMGMGEHFKQMMGGTPEGQKRSGRFIGKLPAAYAQEAMRAMPLGDIPIRDKRGRVVEWRPREEFERTQEVLDPVQRGSADLSLLLADFMDPSPGGEAKALKKASLLFGTAAGRAQLAEVLNIIRKNIRGPARRSLLDRLKRGIALSTPDTQLTRSGNLGDVTFDAREFSTELRPILAEAELGKYMGDPRATRELGRAERVMGREQAIDKKLHARYAGPDTPPLPPGGRLSAFEVAQQGPHSKSTGAHELLHLVEENLPIRLRQQVQDYAEKAGKERPDITRSLEHPVYFLQAVMEGRRFPYSHKDLKRMSQRQGFELTDELIDQANLRAKMEQAGINVEGLYKTVTETFEGSSEFISQLAGESQSLARKMQRRR